MNSIFGAIGKFSQEQILLMGKQLSHRGQFLKVEPISEKGFWGFNSSEKEDRIFRCDQLQIVSDGVIYNREELEIYLFENDYKLKSKSVEEIFLALYLQNGIAGIEKINGDFAFAIWDMSKKNLFLGRDYAGCHPLYYAHFPNRGLVFATEYKAILALADSTFKVDLDMVQCLQHYKKLPVGRTLFKKIFAVKAGMVEIFAENGGFKTDHRMPQITSNVTLTNKADAVASLKTSLIEAVKCRIDNPQKIGIALSGGIDSISIAFICRQLYANAEIHTFTAGYGEDNPDLNTASKVASAIDAQHHAIETPPTLLKNSLPKLVWHLEDPVARSESLQLMKMGETAKNHVSSLICGMEADALFAGMPRHKLLWYMKKYPIFKKSLGEIYDFTQCGIYPQSILGKILKTLYLRDSIPKVPKIKGSDYLPQPTQFPKNSKEYVNLILSSGYQGGACQDGQKLERTFAASGIQYRTPFIDKNLIETAFSISDELKFKNRTNKYILRKTLESIVPAKFLHVPKIPQRMQYNLEFATEIDEVAENYLSCHSINQRSFFEYADIENLARKDYSKPYTAEGAMRIWTAILTEIWARKFLD